jgi:hypothetical protein
MEPGEIYIADLTPASSPAHPGLETRGYQWPSLQDGYAVLRPGPRHRPIVGTTGPTGREIPAQG